MITIYQIGPGGYWTGASREVGERDGMQGGWTRSKVPALEDGEHAVWVGNGWTVASEPYVAPPMPKPSTNPADYPLNKRQFFAMVKTLGKDAEIKTALASMDGTAIQKAFAMERYLASDEYNHGDPLTQALRVAIGMSEADLSAAWMIAKDLKGS